MGIIAGALDVVEKICVFIEYFVQFWKDMVYVILISQLILMFFNKMLPLQLELESGVEEAAQ